MADDRRRQFFKTYKVPRPSQIARRMVLEGHPRILAKGSRTEHTQQCEVSDGAEVRLQIAPRLLYQCQNIPRLKPAILCPLFVSLPVSAESANISNNSAHTAVRLIAMTAPRF